MALATDCQTPGARFYTEIRPMHVSVTVELPFDLHLTEADARLLEANVHNALELVLAPHFNRQLRRKRSLLAWRRTA
jgi:hypothetical protein